MAFQYRDEYREQYYSAGLVILPGVIPASLLDDLRRETDKAREIARKRGGAQIQRLQPVYEYDELKSASFRDFLNLPAMRESVRNILGDGHHPSDIMGVLLEPAEQAWCTNWHRDWGHHIANIGEARFVEASQNPRLFNQLNAALYYDSSLWVVPGSHNRGDTEAERAVFPRWPAEGPQLEGLTSTERELACRAYPRRMPGATEITLGAGDVAFYRACGWHLGTYLPYMKRATLHDGFYCDEDRAWQKEMRELQAANAGQR